MNADAYAVRILPDGRRLDLVPMTFGKWRLYIAPSRDSFAIDNEY